MTAVRCIECEHMTWRPHPDTMHPKSKEAAAKLTRTMGYVRCLQGDHFRFLSPQFPRQCKTHTPASADAVAKRVAWLQSLNTCEAPNATPADSPLL